MGPMTPEEELAAWRKTVRMLDHLCGMADALTLEPLSLALVDAIDRSREELARAQDRLARLDGAKLSPREVERLRGLMLRSDALSTALVAVESDELAYGRKTEYVEILREDFEEASEQFERYKQEVGISS